ncbi:MAG: hypothetical protein IT204_09500 [Fimbriimonadaceae bacterium]|nr:hypothetical protein [Fimbriimonadaceae bacterium]
MAKDASGSAEGKELTPRAQIDWKYVLFYVLFYVCLVFIALFGVIAEV